MIAAEPASFRDPSGRVYEHDGRIFRTVADRAAADYGFVRRSGALDRLVERGWIVGATEVDRDLLGPVGAAARHVVEHPRLPFVSYPYEWPFTALKAAALLHLDCQLALLDSDIMLSDASAYNVQFVGARPVFIDLLSLRQYRDGEYWTGYRQFCEQFLNPLLLRARRGIAHHAWYRGSPEGIPTDALARLLPWRDRLSWRALTHVFLHARLQRGADAAVVEEARRVQARPLPRAGLRALLLGLRRWIAGLDPADRGRTVWADYTATHTYAPAEEAAKRRFVAEFAAAVRPGLLWDLGCNTGAYAEVALAAGAGYAVGFDADVMALDRAFARAAAGGLRLLPLYQDAADPSPDQGWRLRERRGLARRAAPDALIALALEHHLAIGRNVPLPEVVAWLAGLAPCGVIEFVPKDDPTVRRMLALREDVFDDYGEPAFRAALARHARVIRAEAVSATGRTLFWYDRS
ncbi:MAG: hypothetical protein AB7K86_10240 [Rhodospirillales bacterium]